MRTSRKCTKCGSLAIGHIARRYDATGERGVNFNAQVLGVLANRRIGVGPLEAYVCTECGYLETYVIAPDAVAFESIQGFRWVNETSPERGPFR